MSQNYKYFALEKKEDFIEYLLFLIRHTQIYMKQYKRYLKEMEQIIEKMGLRENPLKKIEPELYEDFRNKISTPGDKLLNVLGDETKSAISYRKFRVIVKRKMKKNNLNIGLEELPEEIWNILKELNISRNWGLHIPESLLVAEIEIRKMCEKEKGIVYKRNYNPIKNTVFNYYEGGWIVDLYEECTKLHSGFSIVFQQMKRDYSKLIGESMRMENAVFDVRPLQDMNLPKISTSIQRGEYKGSSDNIWLGFTDIRVVK